MDSDFIIDQASWHTKRIRDYEFDSSIVYSYFRNVSNYLQNNNLTTRIILSDNEEVNDETCIKRSDLTDEGFELIKKAYGNWTDKVVDKKIAPFDFGILDRALKKIRNKK